MEIEPTKNIIEIEPINNIIEIELDDSIGNYTNEVHLSHSESDTSLKKVIYLTNEEKYKKNSIIIYMQIINLITFSISIIVGIASTVVYMKLNKNDRLLLYCLEIDEKSRILFGTSSHSFFVIMTLLFFCLVTSIKVGIEININKKFTKDIFPYLTISLYFLNIPYMISMFTSRRTLTTVIINFILSVCGIYSILNIIYKVNKKKFDEKLMIISECFFSSILLSIFIYSFLFNIISLIEKLGYDNFDSSIEGYALNISANVIYFISALLLLILYRDIMYCSCVVIFELGILSNKGNYFSERLLNVFIVFLTFFTGIWTVFVYKHKVFRINDDN